MGNTATSLPKVPTTSEQKYLAALVAGIEQIVTMLRDFLDQAVGQRQVQEPAPSPAAGGDEEPRLVSEPAPATGPRMAQPVAEPNRGRGAKPPAVSEPLARPGLNAPRTAWQAYADSRGITTRDGAGRGEIITAVDAADAAATAKPAKKKPPRKR